MSNKDVLHGCSAAQSALRSRWCRVQVQLSACLWLLRLATAVLLLLSRENNDVTLRFSSVISLI